MTFDLLPARRWRWLVALWLVGVAPVVRASAAEPLTEADVVRLASTHSPRARVAASTVAVADAMQSTAGLMPNPSLSWDREVVYGGPRDTQDIVRATIPIDVPRALATRALVASSSAQMRADASLERTRGLAEALSAFYDAALARARITALEQALEHLAEATRILSRREDAGDAAGYERSRLALEAELWQSRLAEAHSQEKAALARLSALLDVQGPIEIEVELRPRALEEAATWIEGLPRRREVLAIAKDAERAAAQARRRAGWTWLPSVELVGGSKVVLDPDLQAGYVAGVALSLPFFNRGQELRAQARAQQGLAQARTRAIEQAIAADVAEAAVVHESSFRELQRFDANTSAHTETLLRAAQSGYREGRRSLVELVDAQRAATEVALRRLELQATVKRAEVALRLASGALR